MRPAPSLSRFPEFPVIGAISAMAIFVTVAVQAGKTAIDPFVMSSLAFESEPWRLASSTLPHGDWIHLIFNVVWLWILGTKLEETLGHVTTLVIMFVLAVGTGAAEYALAVGGIGLSGVGYGFVGCLWILSKRDARFRDCMDRNTLLLFIAWGLLCVLMTVTNVKRIGNVAHGSGFVFGMLIGWVIARGSLVRRLLAASVLVGFVGGFVVVAALYRPQVNLSIYAGDEEAARANVALEAKEYERAARLLRRAIALSPSSAHAWYNYGVALQYVTDPNGMTRIEAWRRAAELEPTNELYRSTYAEEASRPSR